MTTRREFIRFAALGIGGFDCRSRAVCACRRYATANRRAVAALCRRLGPLGWRQLLLEATGGELDIAANDLARELGKPLARIDRSFPASAILRSPATRAIEPGSPERSLLYHALASPTVVADREGRELGGFPTLAEIEAVENYVYGAAPPTLEELRQRANGRPLGIVVFAPQYQSAPMSVHARHAELCFARSGIARLGTLEPLYDQRARNFVAARRGAAVRLPRRAAALRRLPRGSDARRLGGVRTAGPAAGGQGPGVLGSDPQAVQRHRMHRGARSRTWNSDAACATMGWRSSIASSI